MGRYRCAIGGCPEKTYRHQPGIRFFSVKSTAEPMKSIWKEKILQTRPDIPNVSVIYDYMICSEHFEDGDKNSIPTIFPENNEEGRRISHRFRHMNESSDSDSKPGMRKSSPYMSSADFNAISLDDSECDSDDEDNKHVKSLKFRNPGRFMEDFNPDKSGREMRKMNRKCYTDKTKKAVYDENGRLLEDGRDLCDCLDGLCPGCHFPCPKCGSGKCGGDCRCNRKWVYQEVEVEGTGQKFYFDPAQQWSQSTQ
jgi:hypothetical protein